MADTSRKIQEFTDRFTSARSRADIRDLFSGDYYREVAVVDTDDGMAAHRITISGTVDGTVINMGRVVNFTDFSSHRLDTDSQTQRIIKGANDGARGYPRTLHVLVDLPDCYSQSYRVDILNDDGASPVDGNITVTVGEVKYNGPDTAGQMYVGDWLTTCTMNEVVDFLKQHNSFYDPDE